jgi:hypothetical protein
VAYKLILSEKLTKNSSQIGKEVKLLMEELKSWNLIQPKGLVEGFMCLEILILINQELIKIYHHNNHLWDLLKTILLGHK